MSILEVSGLALFQNSRQWRPMSAGTAPLAHKTNLVAKLAMVSLLGRCTKFTAVVCTVSF
jgi:hypothetical protein